MSKQDADIMEGLQALRGELHVNELRHSGTRDGNIYSRWGATVAFAMIEIERLRKEVAELEKEYGQPPIAPDILTKEAFASLGVNLVPNPLWGRKV